MFRDLPQIEIAFDGKYLSQSALMGLLEGRVVQALSVPAQCELVFRDPPGPLDDALALRLGQSMRLNVGPGNLLFDGVVTAVEHVFTARNEREIYVRGYDKLHHLRTIQHVRVFEKQTLSQIIRRLAGEAELEIGPIVRLPEEMPWSKTFQHNQNNLAFMNEICARVGRFPVIRGGKLAIVGLDGMAPDVTLALGQNLRAARVEHNDRWRIDEVATLGWNPLTGDLPRSGRPNAGTRILVNEAVASRSDARILAQSYRELRDASTAVFMGEVDGNTEIMPGTPLRLSGLIPSPLERRADGKQFVATRVVHRLDATAGYITEVSTTPPSVSRRPSGTIITPGTIIDVDDPGNHGRVRAKLQVYGDVETDWMQVLASGSGKGKGIINTPDVGDLVLILLVREDPGLGIVLGGVMGTDKVHDSGVENGRVRRSSWRTSGGLLVELDDSENSVWIGNNDGGYIKIENNNIEIAAGSIDFKNK